MPSWYDRFLQEESQKWNEEIDHETTTGYLENPKEDEKEKEEDD